MEVRIDDIGKKYHRNWIFRHLNHIINSGEIVALTGHNGSGKSTLLNTIGGFTTPTEGQVRLDDQTDFDQTSINIATPYLNLLDELTLSEQLAFHSKFKKPLIDLAQMPHLCDLEKSSNKLLQEFSSGMKQRVRLIMAFCFDSSLILLDEPTVNLDEHGAAWYLELLRNQRRKRTTLIASNDPKEYPDVDQIIRMS